MIYAVNESWFFVWLKGQTLHGARIQPLPLGELAGALDVFSSQDGEGIENVIYCDGYL